MYPESSNTADYLASDDIVDWKNPLILVRARELTAGRKSEIDQARCIYEWVRDHVSHSFDAKSDSVTCSASEVLRYHTGICYAKSHLLAALLRASAIPAGFCYQVLMRDPPERGHVLHGLNALYLSDLDRWIRVDARGNTGRINAQFDTEREQLAFPPRPAQGEFTYKPIFAKPAKVVVDALRRYKTCTELRSHLPERLP